MRHTIISKELNQAMEIKELVSQSKEIIIEPKTEEGVFLDAFSYTLSSSGGSPVGRQNSNVGGKNYLYIVSRVESKDPSLDYIPNLIASFIKRELESNTNSNGSAFENSLKKTNELIDGLFKNNANIKLDLGIAFINKEKIAASRIGKAKMLVFRPQNNETFDLFENVTNFRKFHLNNKMFSNIISGEIKKSDRFFFFIPTLRLNLKQKQIFATLTKSEQENFLNAIHKIVSPEEKNKAPVPCSGIHFEIKEETRKVTEEPAKETAPTTEPKEKEPQIIATEVAKINKNDNLKRTAQKFKEMILGENLKSNWRLIRPRGMNNYFLVGVIALVVIVALVLLTKGDSKLKQQVELINEKLRISESKFLLKQNYEARLSLDEAIRELAFLEESRQKGEILTGAITLLNRIEKINPEKKPNPLFDLISSEGIDLTKLRNILFANEKFFVNDSEKIYAAKENELRPLEELGVINLSWIKNRKIITYGTNIKITDLEKDKVSELKRKFNFEPLEMKNYEDNLYFLGSKNIYKISNALVNPIEELDWLKTTEAQKIPGNFVSFALDSSIYVLTDQRKTAILFKGELKKLIDLDFEVKSGTELINLGNDELMAIDKGKKLARVIDNSGVLKVSYDLSGVDTIKDVFFNPESRILYILSPTKIWGLKI